MTMICFYQITDYFNLYEIFCLKYIMIEYNNNWILNCPNTQKKLNSMKKKIVKKLKVIWRKIIADAIWVFLNQIQ